MIYKISLHELLKEFFGIGKVSNYRPPKFENVEMLNYYTFYKKIELIDKYKL